MSAVANNRSVIAIDPGTHKCGIALLLADGSVAWRGIVSREEVLEKVSLLREEHHDAVVVVGASTQGSAIHRQLTEGYGIPAKMVDETDSTMLARELFWEENRPGCFWGIFPPSNRPLPRPIDDYAAVIIGRRFLETGQEHVSK